MKITLVATLSSFLTFLVMSAAADIVMGCNQPLYASAFSYTLALFVLPIVLASTGAVSGALYFILTKDQSRKIFLAYPGLYIGFIMLFPVVQASWSLGLTTDIFRTLCQLGLAVISSFGGTLAGSNAAAAITTRLN